MMTLNQETPQQVTWETLSDNEQKIARIFLDLQKLYGVKILSEVLEIYLITREIQPSTVHAVLLSLQEKGALTFTPSGGELDIFGWYVLSPTLNPPSES